MTGNSKKILVTGGAGYIGSHCAKALAAAGYEPITYDNLSTGHRDFVKWGPLVEGDIRDLGALSQAFEKYKPVAVMHFASLIAVGESVIRPELYYDINVTGTLVLLNAMHAAGVEPIVFSSSAAIYGEPEVSPIPENTPFNPSSPYGATKAICEQMMDDFGNAHGIRSVRLRYFNAAGADPDGEIGEHHEPETHLIPLVLDVALGRRDSIQIFGNDYPTPDGTAIRDYIHVVDLADAHLRGLRYLLDGGLTAAFNVGTGVGSSVKEVIDAVEKVIGINIAQEVTPRRLGDVPSLVAEESKIRKTLKWEAKHSSIDQILSNNLLKEYL